MEGPSSKEASILNSGDVGTQSTSNFNHPAPPPAYEQSHAYPSSNPPPPQPGVLYTPGVTVTQQPGVTVMQPGPMGSVTTTVVGGTIVQTRVIEPIGNMPSLVLCRACNHQNVTRVEHQPTARTHIAALLLCLIGCWPLVCLPYCMSSCQSANHYCSNCGAYIGSR